MTAAVDKKRYMDLSRQRRWYADEVRWNAKLQSERLAKAFATVPRAVMTKLACRDAKLNVMEIGATAT
jgi:hypothetical protein